jgi:hypothetical protein
MVAKAQVISSTHQSHGLQVTKEEKPILKFTSAGQIVVRIGVNKLS